MSVLVISFFLNPNTIDIIKELDGFDDYTPPTTVTDGFRNNIFELLKTPNNVYKLYGFNKHSFTLAGEPYCFFYLELEIPDLEKYRYIQNPVIDIFGRVLSYKGFILTSLNVVDYFTGFNSVFSTDKGVSLDVLAMESVSGIYKRSGWLTQRPHILRAVKEVDCDTNLSVFSQALMSARGVF